MADDNAAAAPAGGSPTETPAAATQADNLLDALASKPTDTPAPAVADPAKPAAAPAPATVDGFLNGKYKTREEFEKGYNELRKTETDLRAKLKGFAGAPEAYELSMPDDLKEVAEWTQDDPLLGEFQGMCKEAGVTQDFFTKCLHMLAKYEYSNVQPDWAKEKAAIGDRADERLKGFEEYYTSQLDEEGVLAVKRALGINPTPSAVFKALELLAGTNRQPAINNPDETVSSAMTVEEINRKYRTVDPNTKQALIDTPDGRKAYRAELAKVVGTGEHHVVVGGARKAS